MSLRDLPPVEENVPPRDKASQTLLARQAVCPRSAYLHIKHDGGPASHEMHRGSALHEFCRRATLALIDRNEHQLPWEVGKDLVAEVVGDHPEWVIPPDEMDVLRIAAFHWCECTVIDPSSVVAVEKLFELELGGMRVRGKVDVAYGVDGTLAVRDYKSQAWIPPQDEIDGKVQLPLYALLVGEGYPVREEPCRVDHDGPCDSACRIETPEAPIGQRFNAFELDEVYPRLEPWLEGTAKVLPYRRYHKDQGGVVTRQELVDHRLYVEGLVENLKHGLKTGDWPAVRGTHCDTCPAKWECPLPAAAREGFGAVDSPEEAEQAAVRLAFLDDERKTLMGSIRGFAKANDVAVPAGADEEFRFETEESERWIVGKKIGRPDTEAAKQAMLDAIDRAVRFGEPFDYKDFRKVDRSSKFAKRKVKPGG